MKYKVTIINGPNLNLLGKRETNIYGNETLSSIESSITELAATWEMNIDFLQSNHEGEIVDQIHQANESSNGIIINPAAFTHTSVAIRDAIAAINIPVIEVHLSNIHAREEFRHHSYIAPVSLGQICGFGPMSYHLALHAMKDYLSRN